MDSIRELLNQYTHLTYLLFFVNGLALFSVALVTGLQSRRAGEGVFARNLWLLTVAALLIGVASWAQMALLIAGSQGRGSAGIFLAASKGITIAAGSIFLLRFGTAMGEASWPRNHGWLRWLPVLLLCVWLTVLLVSLSRNTGGAATWLAEAETLTRRLLFFPALALAGLTIFRYRPAMTTRDLKTRLARASAGAGVAFGFKAIVAGLAAIDAGATGVALGQFSPQAGNTFLLEPLRTLSTIAMAYFVIQMLNRLEDERRLQLDAAKEQHFQAERAARDAEQSSRETIEIWSHHLGAVAKVMVDAIHEPHKLRESLEQTLSDLFAWTGFEAGQVLLKGAGGERLVQVAQRCVCPSNCCNGCKMSKEQLSSISWDHATVQHLDRDSEVVEHPSGAPALQTMLTIPIKCIDDALGIIALGSLRRVKVNSSELGLMEFLGQQIGSAVEHLRVHEQLSSTAVQKERVRLSRDIHDSVAQELDLLYLRLTTLEEMVQDGNLAGAVSESRRAVDLCSVACNELRQSILDLRFAGGAWGSLIAEIQSYADRMTQHSTIGVSVQVCECETLALPGEVEVQILGIVQEALSNIRRHAGAKHANVRITCANGAVTLTISDDGRGFDPTLVENEEYHFGLQTMTERAESVGGSLEISSTPGTGTTLIVKVPALI